jgi:hypothetical protein
MGESLVEPEDYIDLDMIRIKLPSIPQPPIGVLVVPAFRCLTRRTPSGSAYFGSSSKLFCKVEKQPESNS